MHVCAVFDDKFDYFKIVYAMQVIKLTKKFFGTNLDNHVKVEGVNLPGSYTFISALETCSEIKAEICTKPDSKSLHIIMKDHLISDEEKSKILMIGDNLHTDIKFGNNCGIDTLLIFTGVTNEEKFQKHFETYHEHHSLPTYTLKSF